MPGSTSVTKLPVAPLQLNEKGPAEDGTVMFETPHSVEVSELKSPMEAPSHS